MATVAEHRSSPINKSRFSPTEDDLTSKFGALGFGSSQARAAPAQTSGTARSTSQQRKYVPPQQQSLLDAILASGQPKSAPSSQQDLLAMLQLQQAQAAVTQNSHLHAQLVLQAQAQQALLAAQSRQNMSTAQQQYLQQLSLAAQPRSPLMPQDPAPKMRDRSTGTQSSNTKGRNARTDDARTRFENAPSPRIPAFATPQLQSVAGFAPTHSPFSKEVSWQSSFSPGIPSPASALRTSESPATNIAQRRRPEGAGLALLSRRTDGSQSGESRATSPTSPAFPVSAKLGTPGLVSTPQMPGQATLGHGRPLNVNPAPRAWTASTAETVNASIKADLAPRAASYAGSAAPRVVVMRQPYGPPGEASELGDRNFQSRIRKQAGRGLGLLSRRGDTPVSTPVIG